MLYLTGLNFERTNLGKFSVGWFLIDPSVTNKDLKSLARWEFVRIGFVGLNPNTAA
jgi:hypothetical protein